MTALLVYSHGGGTTHNPVYLNSSPSPKTFCLSESPYLRSNAAILCICMSTTRFVCLFIMDNCCALEQVYTGY